MSAIEWLTKLFNRNKELAIMYDEELLGDQSKKVHLKRLALQTCADFIGRTVSQSEFVIINGKDRKKNEMYYRLNIRPNQNMSAAMFWQTVVHKLINDNECLIVQTDAGDLVIADSFSRNHFTLYEDTFNHVVVGNYTFKRTFVMSDVIYIEYSNDKLARLIDDLYSDYGELFARVLSFQKRKNQIRATVNAETVGAMTDKDIKGLQTFVNKLYRAIEDKDVAVVPQQKGFEYKEHQSSSAGAGVEEINKVTDGFLDKVATALGIPISLLRGDMADVEKQTRNYTIFCVKPLLKKISDELNAKLFSKSAYLSGNKIEIQTVSYQNIFDLATSIDKLISSGAFSPNKVLRELGFDTVDDPKMDEHYITKNYEKMKGGEDDETQD